MVFFIPSEIPCVLQHLMLLYSKWTVVMICAFFSLHLVCSGRAVMEYCRYTLRKDSSLQWSCTIEIAWVDLGRPYPGSYKLEILANRGQKVRSRSSGRSNRARPMHIFISLMMLADNFQWDLFPEAGLVRILEECGTWTIHIGI